MNNLSKMTSDLYKVRILGEKRRDIDVCVALSADGTENSRKLPPEVFSEFDGLGLGIPTIKTYYANIEFEDYAVIDIEMPIGTEKIDIKPKRYMQYVEFKEGNAVIKADRTMNFYIEPDGDIFGGIHIFCNRKKPFQNKNKNLIEFKSGVYTEENCKYIRLNEFGAPIIDCIESDTTIYLENGATVKAAIVLENKKNVKICGSGEISLIDRCHGAKENFCQDRYWGAFRKNALPNIYIKSGCENIEVSDVVLNCEFRGIVVRNSKNINFNNVKIFTSTENADGINCINTSDMMVDSCYIQSADDCFCMYNSCDSILWFADEKYKNPSGLCENVEVKNCTMASNARPFVIGGHATGNKIKRCEIKNIYIHDCEIIYTPYRIFGNSKEYSMYWSGLMRILSQSEQTVSNILFENMTFDVTKGHNGKPVHIEVRAKNAASYTETSGYRIENIKFKNIVFIGETKDMVQSLVKCGVDNCDTCGIYDVEFDNFKIGDTHITDDDIIKNGKVINLKIHS